MATVSSSGLLTAVSAGEATISAEVTPGGRGSLRIRVFPKFHGHWEGNLNFTRQTVSADWREFGYEECEGLDNCSSWVPLAADFTQDGAAVTGSVRTTFSAPPNFEWTVQGDVSIDGTLNLTFDEIALPIEAPIEVRAMYISWKSRADAPGVMTGTAARQISSDALSGNILSEGCLGRAYKRRECSGWRSSDSPDPMLAPADEAAFNDLVVGKRVATNYPTVYVDFVSPGRFRATEGADTYTGSYTYQNTGSNTGTLTFNYDDGDRCTTHLTFASAMAGTATFTCNDGESGAYDWRLVEIPPDDGDGDGDTNGVCATGSTIESGSECALQYPQGTPDAGLKFGRFAVGVQLGSEKGCLYIGSGFLSCSSSSISRNLTLTTGSGNQYSFGFAASKIEDSSSWRISKLSITLQE